VALLQKMTCNLGHPMGLRHPVCTNDVHVFTHTLSIYIDTCTQHNMKYITITQGVHFTCTYSIYISRYICIPVYHNHTGSSLYVHILYLYVSIHMYTYVSHSHREFTLRAATIISTAAFPVYNDIPTYLHIHP